MNVRLQYDLDFMAGIYYENRLQINNYSASIQLLTQISNSVEINIAMERVKAFVYAELADTVFFGPQDGEKAEMFQILGTNVTTLPDQPVDQIIGIMLYCKLNAVMQGRMIVTKLDIQSYLGDSVWYSHDEEDAIGLFAEDGWWHKESCQHNAIDSDPASGKVVKVVNSGWHEYGLDWPEAVQENTGNTVVFANFTTNENQPTQ